MMTTETATTSITTPEYDIPPTVYTFGEYKYSIYANNIHTDTLLYEGIEYMSYIGLYYPIVTEKIRMVLAHSHTDHVAPTPTERWMTDVVDLRKEIRQTTISIQKMTHTINKKIRDAKKRQDQYFDEYELADSDEYHVLHYELESYYEQQQKYLELNLEIGICLTFVDDLEEYVTVCDAAKQSLLQDTKIPEAIIMHDIIAFL